jgi:hypothetical protein
MTRQESIDYIHLRAEECGFSEKILEQVRESLKQLEEKDFDRLKKISEPIFRDWCKNLSNEDTHE